MLPDEFFAEPLSSYQFPVPVPTSDPDTGTLHYCAFSDSWLVLVIGSLKQLLQQTTWDTDDETALLLAQQQADKLIQIVAEGVVMYPTGAIVSYGGSAAPTDWLLCDGSAVSRATYANLFAVIGTAFGPGDGVTTFNLPDLGGRVPIGVSGTHALATDGGEETHTLVTAEMPAHTHTDSGHSHSTGNSLLIATATPPPLDVLGPNPIPASTGLASANLTNTGGDGAHNNMQPFLALTAIIKT